MASVEQPVREHSDVSRPDSRTTPSSPTFSEENVEQEEQQEVKTAHETPLEAWSCRNTWQLFFITLERLVIVAACLVHLGLLLVYESQTLTQAGYSDSIILLEFIPVWISIGILCVQNCCPRCFRRCLDCCFSEECVTEKYFLFATML